MKDQCIGVNIRQKMKNMQQMSIDILLNQNLLELTDWLFSFIQFKMTIQKGMKPKHIV